MEPKSQDPVVTPRKAHEDRNSEKAPSGKKLERTVATAIPGKWLQLAVMAAPFMLPIFASRSSRPDLRGGHGQGSRRTMAFGLQDRHVERYRRHLRADQRRPQCRSGWMPARAH